MDKYLVFTRPQVFLALGDSLEPLFPMLDLVG